MRKCLPLLVLLLGISAPALAQKSAQFIKQIEEKPTRFFLRPITNHYIRDFENDFDNSAYMDIEIKGDVITLTVMALVEEEGGYLQSSSVHGDDFSIHHTYIKVLGDVYISQDDLNNNTSGIYANTLTHILYNPAKGVYYHRYESPNNRGEDSFAPTKTKSKEKINAYELTKGYEKQYEDAVAYYNAEIPKRLSAALMAKPDNGMSTDFHKANANKILFGNNITTANAMQATTYKSSFTVDEPVMMTIFADKGFNKFIDRSESDPEKMENLNRDGESVFLLNAKFSNGKSVSRTMYVAHPEGQRLTFDIKDLVLGKGKSSGSNDNLWIKDKANLDNLSSDVTVTVEVVNFKDEQNLVAQGTFTYSPKAGAVMPYGKTCSLGDNVKIANIDKLKAALATNFKKALANKAETKAYTLVELTITTDWQETNELAYPFVEVNFILKDQAGKCYSGNDRYLWLDDKMPAEQAGYFFYAESKHSSILTDLYPYCDCK
jgi:hypothetical protein